MILPDADVQIAATALYHGLELVTGNLRHFQKFRNFLLFSKLYLLDLRKFHNFHKIHSISNGLISFII